MPVHHHNKNLLRRAVKHVADGRDGVLQNGRDNRQVFRIMRRELEGCVVHDVLLSPVCAVESPSRWGGVRVQTQLRGVIPHGARSIGCVRRCGIQFDFLLRARLLLRNTLLIAIRNHLLK